MNILAFDTTAAGCSAAIVDAGGTILAHRALNLPHGHAEHLMPMVRDVLAEAALKVAALDLIAVTTGPGTFTGIRVGLAAARGLALASGVPLLGVTSFAAVAAAVTPTERAGRTLVVAIESRRADIFVQTFGADGAAATPASVSPELLARWLPRGELLFAGDAAARARAILDAAGRGAMPARHDGPPDAAYVARAALAVWRPGAMPPPPSPFYLREPDVTVPGQSTAAS